jgi:hypothetical protein
MRLHSDSKVWTIELVIDEDADETEGHCCVGRKSDMTVAPGRALRVGKHTTGVYTAADKAPISRLTTAPTVPRRRNATVPTRPTRDTPPLSRATSFSPTCSAPATATSNPANATSSQWSPATSPRSPTYLARGPPGPRPV